jgi:hypothetical protein
METISTNAEETVLHVFSDCLKLSVIRANLKVPGATILHTDPELGLKFYREALAIINQYKIK